MDNVIGLKHNLPTNPPRPGSLNEWLLSKGPFTRYTTTLNAEWLQAMIAAGNTFKTVSSTKDLIAHLQDPDRRNTTAWEVLILVKAGYTVSVHDTDKLLFTPPAAPVNSPELQQIIQNGITALASKGSGPWKGFWDTPPTNYRQVTLQIYAAAMPVAAPQMIEHGRA